MFANFAPPHATRVVTVDQAQNGNSLETQRQVLADFAQLEGLSIDFMFNDRAISGSNPLLDRTAGAALLGALTAGDAVFCAKLDRMFRNASDALATLDALKASGVRVFLKDMGGDVTGNGVSGLVFSILAAAAQFERERIVERISENRARLTGAGRHVGGRVPFGMKVEDGEYDRGRPARCLAEDAVEQDTTALKAVHADEAGVRAIQATMKAQGMPIAPATIAKLTAGRGRGAQSARAWYRPAFSERHQIGTAALVSA
jgi:DNA invertase Pin-like site-specific DNA recombinase